MELNSPTEARFRVSGEDKTRVSLNTHGSVMGIHSRGLLGREHSLHLSLSLSLSLWLEALRRNTKEIQEQMRCKIGGRIRCVLKKREGGVNGFGYLLRYKAQWKELADYLKECIQYVKFILKIKNKKIKLPYYSNMQTFLCQKTPHSLAPSLFLSLSPFLFL